MTVDIRQVFGESPQVMTEILQDGVNLAVWQRRLPAQVEDFANLVLSLGQPLADERVIEVDERQPPALPGLLREPPIYMATMVSSPMWPGWWRPIPACWVLGAWGCGCGCLRGRCARACMWTMFHCACSVPTLAQVANGCQRVPSIVPGCSWRRRLWITSGDWWRER